jgi:hypothetical protein
MVLLLVSDVGIGHLVDHLLHRIYLTRHHTNNPGLAAQRKVGM